MALDEQIVLKREVIAYWELQPGNRPVKITSIVRDPMFWTEGYITCYKFVAGRTLPEAEKILGLPAGELMGGAYLYEFLKLPAIDQFELKGYSQCPGGERWTPESKFPPGLGAPQWRVLCDTFIATRLAAIVGKDGRLP